MKTRIVFLLFSLFISSIGLAQGFVGIGTTTPGSNLTINGSLGVTYSNITATAYTMTASDFYLAWNGTANGTATLPPALAIGSGNFKGRMYYVKNTSSSYALTIAANGSEGIDNQTGTAPSSVILQPGTFTIMVSTGLLSGATWEMAIVGTSSQLKPYFKASKSSFTPGSTAVTVTGLTESVDDRNNFDPSTGTFTAPEDGYYMFTYSTGTANNVSGVLSQSITGSGAQTINLIGTAGYPSNFTNAYFLKLSKGTTVNMTVLFAVSSGSGAVSCEFTGTQL